MTEETNLHPAAALPLDERVDYLCVVATLTSADGEVSDAEILKLRELATAMQVRGKHFGAVIAATEDADRDQIRASLTRLRVSELRFTLLTDLVFMAYADDQYTSEEQAEVAAIADALGVTPEQTASLCRYVEAVRRAASADGATAEDFKKLGGDVAAGLASVGVPVGAVAVSGSVFGVSAAGITSGLAALGMGFGMLSGVGVAVGLGVGTFFGVRWLYRTVTGA